MSAASDTPAPALSSPPPVGVPVDWGAATVVLAPNGGPMTGWGTNTFLVGETDLAVIDPGPLDQSHHDALLATIGGRRVRAVLVSHPHLDHSPLARPLAEEVGAPVLGYGPAGAGRAPVMEQFADLGGGEGVDATFAPDEELREGDLISGTDWDLEVLELPGHFAGHLGFARGDVVLSGDHVMGWTSTFISPPDGDVAAFRASCTKLLDRAPRRLLASHGAPIEDPEARLRWLLEHRAGREAQILAALTDGPLALRTLTERVYADTPGAMIAAGERNVLAHLIDLATRGTVRAEPALTVSAEFSRA